jgi:hypothetical protein
MNGPHFNYLTNAYVEALGLEPWMRERPEPTYVDMQIVPGIKLCGVPMRGFDRVVVYNHMLYAQALDGLSWDRIERPL